MKADNMWPIQIRYLDEELGYVLLSPWTGGPLKPSFGLSGLQFHCWIEFAFVRVFLPSTRIQSSPCLHPRKLLYCQNNGPTLAKRRLEWATRPTPTWFRVARKLCSSASDCPAENAR
jgi:hypothetical protein